MWHEARRQERKIRGMIVDYRKRAERRQDFYEKIKADPTQFIQLHGRKCKIHLDAAVAAAGDGAAIIVPWQGQQDNLIDRFDVRAHLDHITPASKVTVCEDVGAEERQCNYERYRILAQNDFLNLPEEKFLHQLYLEEQYGANAQLEAERNLGKKKPTGAAIAYSYDDADSSTPFSHIPSATVQHCDDDNDSVGSEIDMDVSIDISKLDTSQAHELNACGRNYGMLSNDFYSYLTKDVDEADAIRLAREEEQEKMMLSGRKSRRERRAQKDRRVAGRPLSPPSYAAKEEPTDDAKDNDTDSRSPSPENSGKITYITSFGGEDELQPHSKILISMNKTNKSGPGLTSQAGQATYAQKVKENLEKLKQVQERRPERPKQYQYRSRSRSRSRSRGRYRRSSSRSRRRRTRSRSRGRRYHRSRSRSRSRRSRSRRRRRYSSSPRSTPSPSTDRGGRRRHSPPRNRSSSKPKIKPWPPDKAAEIVKPPPPPPVVVEPPKLPPMIQYPVLPIHRNIPTLQQPAGPAKQAAEVPQPLPEEPPPIKRYYGRKRPGDSSESEDDAAKAAHQSDDEHSNDDDPDDQALMDVETSSDRSNQFPHSSSGGGCGSGTGTGKQNSKKLLSAHGTNNSSSTETKVGTSSGNGSGNKNPLNPRERLKRKMQILLNKQYKADKKAEIEKTERQLQQQQEREDEMRELALKLRRRQRELRHKFGTPKSSDGGGKSSDDESTADVLKTEQKSRSPSQTSVKSVKSTRSNHRNSRDREKTRSRRSPSRDRHRARSPSRSRSGHRQRRRNSRSRSRNRRSASRRRNQSRDRYRRDSRDRRNRHRRSRSRSRTNIVNRHRESDRHPSTQSRNYDRASHPTQTNEGERNNRNRIVISAPPKLKKLVDY